MTDPLTEEIGLLVTAATEAADDAGQHRDYRGKYVHVGRGLVYALSALALAVERFAAAVHPKEESQ